VRYGATRVPRAVGDGAGRPHRLLDGRRRDDGHHDRNDDYRHDNHDGDGDYRHDRIDDNADAHLRATLLGPAVTVPVTSERGNLGLRPNEV